MKNVKDTMCYEIRVQWQPKGKTYNEMEALNQVCFATKEIIGKITELTSKKTIEIVDSTVEPFFSSPSPYYKKYKTIKKYGETYEEGIGKPIGITPAQAGVDVLIYAKEKGKKSGKNKKM